MELFKNLFQRRLNRRNYVVGLLLVLLLLLLYFPFISVIEQGAKLFLHLSPQNTYIQGTEVILGWILLLTVCIFIGSFSWRRWNDLGSFGEKVWSQNIFALFFTPLRLVELFKEGDKKANKYGNPPDSEIDIKNLLGLS